jgi:hypothetical protein
VLIEKFNIVASIMTIVVVAAIVIIVVVPFIQSGLKHIHVVAHVTCTAFCPPKAGFHAINRNNKQQTTDGGLLLDTQGLTNTEKYHENEQSFRKNLFPLDVDEIGFRRYKKTCQVG